MLSINKGDRKEPVESNKALKPFAINCVMKNDGAPGTTVALMCDAGLVVRQQAEACEFAKNLLNAKSVNWEEVR